MTDITLILARFIGIYFLVAGLGVVVRRRTMSEFVERFRSDAVLSYVAGVLALWFGLVILALHWEWGDAIAAGITLIGLIAALKGALLIVFGKRLLVLARPFDEDLNLAGIWGLVIAALGAVMIWASLAA